VDWGGDLVKKEKNLGHSRILGKEGKGLKGARKSSNTSLHLSDGLGGIPFEKRYKIGEGKICDIKRRGT